MATIVNNPPAQTRESGNGMGFLVGVILLIVFVILAIYYGLPLLRGATTAPQVNVPGQVDVNVDTPAK